MSHHPHRRYLDMARMRDSFRVFHGDLSQVLGTNLWPIPTGSQAAKELETAGGRSESVRDALSQGALLIESAADHLILFTKALDEPVQAFAPLTCVRSVLEAGAFGAWLLDPEIDMEERIRRSMGRRIQGLEEQKKFSRATKSAEMLIHSTERHEQAKQAPQSVGLQAARVPSATQVIEDQFGNEAQYRLLSGVAHGHSWALKESGYASPDEAIKEIGFFSTDKQVNPTFICYAGLIAFQAIRRAAGHLVVLFGLDRPRFEGAVQEHIKRVLTSSH